MGAPFHGYDALIYVGGTELVGGNSWTLSIPASDVMVRQFNDAGPRRVAGPYDWSGTITAWDQGDEQILTSAAIGVAAVALLLYPSRSDSADFYQGSVIMSADSAGGTEAAVNKNGSFVGSTALTINGFT